MWIRAMALGVTVSSLLLFGCGDDSDSGSGGASGGTGTGGAATGGTGGSGVGGAGGSLPDKSCRQSEECDGNQEYCRRPGATRPCGICYTPPDTCDTDDECADRGEEFICEKPSCACDDTKECGPGCTDDIVCGEARVCGTDHRCVAQPCGDGAPCPTNFDCASETSTCTRRSCQSDSECDGFCVLDHCYDKLGTCTPPSA